MPGDSDPVLDDALKKIRDSFLVRLKNDVDEIGSLLGGARPGVPTAGMLDRARHVAHGLAGTGAIFGFPQVSIAARKLEKYIEQYDGVADACDHPERLEALITDLTNASMGPGSPE